MRFIALIAAATVATATVAGAASHSSVDRNNDGVITLDEWNYTYGTEESRIGFQHSDRDGNGTLSQKEFIRAQAYGVLND